MKRSELFFSAIQVPVDFIMLVLAALTAFYIRNVPEFVAFAMQNVSDFINFQPKLYNFTFDAYLKIVLLITPIFL